MPVHFPIANIGEGPWCHDAGRLVYRVCITAVPSLHPQYILSLHTTGFSDSRGGLPHRLCLAVEASVRAKPVNAPRLDSHSPYVLGTAVSRGMASSTV